jgi:hypothetical protein
LINDEHLDINSDKEKITKLEYDFVKEFTFKTMQHLFGRDANPSTLSENNFYLLKQYILSIGYVVDVECTETETDYIYKIKFDRYQNKN